MREINIKSLAESVDSPASGDSLWCHVTKIFIRQLDIDMGEGFAEIWDSGVLQIWTVSPSHRQTDQTARQNFWWRKC